MRKTSAYANRRRPAQRDDLMVTNPIAQAVARKRVEAELRDAQRGAILSGLDACERLLPRLNTWSLAAGALALGDLLETRSFHAGDVRAVLHGATA